MLSYETMYAAKFKNVSSATFDRFSPMEITGYTIEGGDLLLECDEAKPSDLMATNAAFPVGANETGTCDVKGGLRWGQLDTDYEHGTAIGPVEGESHYTDGGSGYFCIGDPATGNRGLLLGAGGTGGGDPLNIDRFIFTKDMAAGDLDGEARLLVDDPYFWYTVASPVERLALEVQDASDNGFDTGKVKVGEWVKQTSPEGFFRYDGDQSNTTADDPDDWFEFSELGIEIRIVDREEATIAYGSYVDCAGNGKESVDADPDATPPVEAVPGEGGFRGKAYQFTSDYDDTGFPGFYIVSVESLVPIVHVEIINDGISGGTAIDSLKPKYLGDQGSQLRHRGAGSGTHNRLPKQQIFNRSGGLPDILGVADVLDVHDLLRASSYSQKWAIVQMPKSDIYIYSHRLGGESLRVGMLRYGQVIPGATWDNDPETDTWSLNSGLGTILMLDQSSTNTSLDDKLTAGDTYLQVYNRYSKYIDVSEPGKALLIYVLGQNIIEVGCTEIEWDQS